MIKTFVTEGEWTLEEFRQALTRVTRQQLTSFLTQRGSEGRQKKTSAYQLSWEFFNWRNKLGQPLSGARVAKEVAHVQKQELKRRREEAKEKRRLAKLEQRRLKRSQAELEAETSADAQAESEEMADLKAKRQRTDDRIVLGEVRDEMANREFLRPPRKNAKVAGWNPDYVEPSRTLSLL